MRKWRAFDGATINKELSELPSEDFYRLTAAMKAYRLDQKVGYVVRSYGDGLMMVKDDSHGQGRCVFFAVREVAGEEVLTALLVYKKETQEAPKRVLDAARRRMENER